MTASRSTYRRAGWIASGGAAAALLGAGYIARNWLRYGHIARDGDADALLDQFMPEYDVVERHATEVAAPAPITYAAACALDIERSRLVRTVFRGRELLMGGEHDETHVAGSLLTQVLALGWRVLAEEPGHEVVVGAVTRPWEANVQFKGLAPDDFASFDMPRFVKIVWNFAVEATGPTSSVFRTETRVATTDGYARKRFRRYWAVVSPGIRLIRRQSVKLVRADAERRYRTAVAVESPAT